ncbi:Pick C1-like protein 1 [Seminavis robusta]|uniref:Pick C1-like protein 1 n=1 Tax=Seminavis robusta TaxID=568900 RepID=A0A9N8E9H4_9STRA|nr:Pick C1-like protein 1 [Seminavis robusta]|eukprot:Sro804_g204930.1 Pick C1-like protein 1 (1164) ;mRNA; f:36958-40867
MIHNNSNSNDHSSPQSGNRTMISTNSPPQPELPSNSPPRSSAAMVHPVTPPPRNHRSDASLTASSSATTLTASDFPLSDDDMSTLQPPSCSRGSQCVQLLAVGHMSPNGVAVVPQLVALQKKKTPNKDKKQSCVDCGGCLCCCSCGEEEAVELGVEDSIQMARVHSIKLGSANAQRIQTMFHESTQFHRNSSALTLPMEYSALQLGKSSSSAESSEEELRVKRLGSQGSSNSDVGSRSPSSGDENHHPPTRLFGGKKTRRTSRHLPRHTEGGCGTRWHNIINRIRIWTCRFLRFMTHYAAVYPKLCISAVILTSLTLITIGMCTNFYLELENAYLWPPQNSLSIEHTDWYYYNSNFNYDTSYFDMIIHAKGDNVLGVDGVKRTFEAIDAIRDLEGYKEGCYWAALFGDEYFVGECKIHSVADFWNESLAIFEEQVETDQDAIFAMSNPRYPNGIYVDEPRILGKATRYATSHDDDATTYLESAQSYLIEFDLPWTNMTADFEWSALERIQALQAEWDADPNNPFTIEMTAYRSYSDEFFRAIIKDLPLLPAVFTIMSAFCCFVFWHRDRVKSRMLLGVGAVVCIVLSIISGYGLLFIFGVPFTSVTTMIPFLLFGVGLDDSFIIFGSYNRTDPRLSAYERIQHTIDDVGLSISLTTLTSSLAFFMGTFSNIPAVSWVCWYAFPTIIIDFIYQVTFFISLIVLDERRIQANKKDICFWSVAEKDDCLQQGETFSDNEDSPVKQPNDNTIRTNTDEEAVVEKGIVEKVPSKSLPQDDLEPYVAEKTHFADRFMYWWAKRMLRPFNQGIVVVLFLVVLATSLIAATRLKQEFNYIDMVPNDSYLKDYFTAIDDYTVRNGLYVYVFFRDVDQSDPDVQQQMLDYIDDLNDSDAIAHYPVYFWLRDFNQFVADNPKLADLTFNEKIATFFKDPGWEDLYGEHVVISDDGSVIESRCVAYVDVNMQKSKDGTDMLKEMRAVSSRQPINQGKEHWPFLTYSDEYHILEFYSVVVDELISTTIMGVVAVSVIAMIFIPHWTAVLFVFPFISFLYIDMLGFLYISGVQINAISYMTLVMSIGLMVDFIMHILLRYYESKGTREERVVETLSTMGASILVGAISTFLGVLLLAFSTSEIINNIFVSFIGLVSFGVLHGLVFLPVLLAMVGPEY